MTDVPNIYGIHPVLGRLRTDPQKVRTLWLISARKDARIREIQELAHKANIPINNIDKQGMERLLGDVRHQGVAAMVEALDYSDESDLMNLISNLDSPALLLILDGVQDPHNLGACLRSADAAGVHAVIAPKDRAVGLTAVARKAACGADSSVPFIQVTNLARTMKTLQDNGIWITGADGDADTSLYEQDLTGPVALVMGAEGKGLRRLTREHCDYLMSIPMAGQVESLNVSVATGICLFEAVRQRKIQQD
jgi:23S rRNA (guanosine2251-2'-O)-methyltransferase